MNMINMIKSFEDMERFMYGEPGSERLADIPDHIWILNVEKALGFRLFAWQKLMIIGATREYGRRTGKSLTWALMKLHGTVPIDMTMESMRKRSNRARCNYQLLKEVAEKLDEKKVPHAPVCRTRKQLDEAVRKMGMVGRMSGRHPDIVLIDDLPLSDQV